MLNKYHHDSVLLIFEPDVFPLTNVDVMLPEIKFVLEHIFLPEVLVAVAAVSVKLQVCCVLMILLRKIRRFCGEQNLLEQNRQSPEESSCSGIRATVASVRKTGNLSTVAIVSHPNCQKPQEHKHSETVCINVFRNIFRITSYMYIYTYIYVYICVYINTHTHIYTYKCDVYIYMCIYIHITYTHKYTSHLYDRSVLRQHIDKYL